MKKLILTIMFVMLAVLTISGQDYDDQYYEYDDQYYNGGDYGYNSPAEYEEYYYDYENILPMIGRYGNVYYWQHPYKYINFVIIGRRVYVFPRDIFFRVYRRGMFFSVSMDRFIHLSCFGMPYYDNYYRFSFYNDYYRYNYYRGRSYGTSWFRGLRNQYTRYYRDRWTSRKYMTLKNRFISKRGLGRSNYKSRYIGSTSRKAYPRSSYNSNRNSGNTYYSKKRSDSRSVYGKTNYSKGKSYKSYNTGKSRGTVKKLSSRSIRRGGTIT